MISCHGSRLVKICRKLQKTFGCFCYLYTIFWKLHDTFCQQSLNCHVTIGWSLFVGKLGKFAESMGALMNRKKGKNAINNGSFWRSTYVSAKTTGLVSSMNLKRVFMVKDKHLSANILLCCKHRTWKISNSAFSKKTSFCIPSIPQRQPCICGSGMNTETTGSLHCSGGHRSLTCHKVRIPLIILCKEVNFLWNPEISGFISGIKPSFDNCLPV